MDYSKLKEDVKKNMAKFESDKTEKTYQCHCKDGYFCQICSCIQRRKKPYNGPVTKARIKDSLLCIDTYLLHSGGNCSVSIYPTSPELDRLHIKDCAIISKDEYHRLKLLDIENKKEKKKPESEGGAFYMCSCEGDHICGGCEYVAWLKSEKVK